MQTLSQSSLRDTPPRPWTLWAFALIVALVGVYNLLLAWDQSRHAGTYRDLGVSYPPLLRAFFALVWGIIFVGFGVALARRRSWVRRWIVVLVSTYGAFNVLWLVVYAESDFGRDQIPFRAALAAIAAAITALITRWRRVRQAF